MSISCIHGRKGGRLQAYHTTKLMPHWKPHKNGLQEEAFSSHKSDWVLGDTYGDWDLPLVTSFDGQKGRLKRFPVPAVLLVTLKDCIVIFCLNHLSANLLWFSWIRTSHNYNQSKCNPILSIFCSILISALD